MSSGPLPDRAFEPVVLERELEALCARLLLRDGKPAKMRRACASVLELLDATAGVTLQERWTALETEHWARWEQGVGRLEPQRQWTWGLAALVLARAVRPGWELLSRARLSQWISSAARRGPAQDRDAVVARAHRGRRVGARRRAPPRVSARRADHPALRLRAGRADHRSRPARGTGPGLPGHGRARRRALRRGDPRPDAVAWRAAPPAGPAADTGRAGRRLADPAQYRAGHQRYLE